MATISIRLGAEHARFLEIVAARSGKTKSQVVRDALNVLHQRQGQDLVDESPYQRLAHLIGCFDSGGQALSEKTGERFAELLKEQSRHVARRRRTSGRSA
jgi:hypothetical protein